MDQIIFRDRNDAGRQLAQRLQDFRETDSIVLAIPRGGVPVGYQIASQLGLPLEVILSKKIAFPDNEEYAVGAVSTDSIVLNTDTYADDEFIRMEAARLRKVLKEKYALFESRLEEIDLSNKNIILVDDGIATGSTILACIETLRKKNPASITVATPVVPADRVRTFENASDQFIYLHAPSFFSSVGAFYEHFDQVEDSEVKRLLSQCR